MNKLEGIHFLEAFKLPTVELISQDELLKSTEPIKKGLSVRSSPKKNNRYERNVYLPSIHNCTDKKQIQDFIDTYGKKFEIFIHETVCPESIGSISKFNDKNCIVLESYKNFVDRKNEIIDNRMIIPMMGHKPWFSKLELLKNDKTDFNRFRKVLYYLRNIPFQEFDMEYVIQNDEVVFTDLTLPNGREYHSVIDYLKSDVER